MIKTKETPTHEYYLDFFEGQPVKLMVDKRTREVLFDADSVAAVLGYESTAAMMADDGVLDAINEHKQQTGESPIRKLNPSTTIMTSSTHTHSLPQHIQWVLLTSETGLQSWHRTSRLLANSCHIEFPAIVERLTQGLPVHFTQSGISIQALPMSPKEQLRRDHLLTYERAGFLLSAFRYNLALYYKDDTEYYSMNEQAERNILPRPAILANRHNTPILEGNGLVIDVFSPLGEESANFYLGPNFHYDSL